MIKLSWEEFIEAAMRDIRTRWPTVKGPVFMTTNTYEPDSPMYAFPVYVEMELGS